MKFMTRHVPSGVTGEYNCEWQASSEQAVVTGNVPYPLEGQASPEQTVVTGNVHYPGSGPYPIRFTGRGIIGKSGVRRGSKGWNVWPA